MHTISVCEKSTMEYLKSQQLEDNNATKEAFPWLSKFSRIIRLSIGSRNYQLLEQSLLLYIQNILSSIGKNNVKSDDTINLKNHISNMLIFFHLYWLDIKQDIADHSSYLNKISTLLIIYLDTELKISMEKTFSHVKDSSKIAAKLFAALYIYLNGSEEHIFRVLLRIKNATEKHTKVCDYIFMKSFTNLTIKITPITDIAYIRCLIAFKMWEKMEGSYDKKERITKLAARLLGSRMPKLRDELLEFVPKPPTDQINETLWLLQSNIFDLQQAHKRFLLLEDKLDLECNKMIYTTWTCPKYQKHQINSMYYQTEPTEKAINHEINKDHLNSLQNHKKIRNFNENKTIDQTYLIKKRTESRKSLKKKRKKTGKTIIIDLTGDDESSVPYKIKREKNKRDLPQLRVTKTEYKLQKHINTSKNSNLPKLTDTNNQENPNKDNKSSVDKILLEYKLISDNKVNGSMEYRTSINNRSLLNDTYRTNFPKNEHLSVTRDQMSNICAEFEKEDEMQHSLKLPELVDCNIKEFKTVANVSEENKLEDPILSHMTYVTENTANFYNNPIMQNKETSQEESAMETIPSFKMCQDNIADQHSLKQELPTSMNCNTMQKSHKCCEAVPVDVHMDRLIIEKLKSINDHSSQITEIIKQKVCHQVNECTNCCMKNERKPFVLTNKDVTTARIQNTLHNTFNDNENNVKSACDTNIIYMLSDRNKCVYVVNHFDGHVHSENKMQCLNKPNDICTASTFTGDQIVESPLHSQHVNFDNIKVNDYANNIKYSETAAKEQQQKKNCDTSILNDWLHQFHYDETKTDCYIDDSENTEFVYNIQGETLEDFLERPFMVSQISYDSSTDVAAKKSLTCTDNDVTAVKTQDTLHNIFGDNENNVNSAHDTNIIYMLSDPNKRVCVTNHIGECIMTMNAEKEMRCLDKSNRMCIVSTTFNANQIAESTLDRHVNFDNLRTNDHEDVFKYSESTMKEQQRKSNYDISNDRIHSSESCIFDINSSEIDSKEKGKIDGIDDLENIRVLYNIQNETLEDFLCQSSIMSQITHDNSVGMSIKKEKNILSAAMSNDTTDFLSQSPIEFDSTTDILLSEKNISCNNQNNIIDNSLDPVAFRLNADDIFLQVPTMQFDKSMFQRAMECRYSYR